MTETEFRKELKTWAKQVGEFRVDEILDRFDRYRERLAELNQERADFDRGVEL